MSRNNLSNRSKEISLPTIYDEDSDFIEQITTALAVPRNVLAENEEIEAVWTNLPRHLKQIPQKYRTELLARLCVAARVGLFDASVNYIWNIGITALRDKVVTFGLNVVAQIKSKNFSESDLHEIQDSSLLDLCLELNLISQEGYFFLDQCRSIRNSFSAAHPAVGIIDDAELLAFVSRVVKFALNSEINHQGVDINQLMKAVRNSSFSEDQASYWENKINRTYGVQLKSILSAMHGIYCDSTQKEEARQNALIISIGTKEKIDISLCGEIVTRHSEYVGAGSDEKQKASTEFFQKMGILEFLNDHEKHALVVKASKMLLSAHLAFNNFYNEPPFAEKLFEISQQIKIPQTAKHEFVQSVALGFIGNGYGVSIMAMPYYQDMVRSFSPREVGILFELCTESESKLANRLRSSSDCRSRFKSLVKSLNSHTVPSKAKSEYMQWLS